MEHQIRPCCWCRCRRYSGGKGESKTWCKAAEGLQSGHSTQTTGPGAARRQQGGVCPPYRCFSPFRSALPSLWGSFVRGERGLRWLCRACRCCWMQKGTSQRSRSSGTRNAQHRQDVVARTRGWRTRSCEPGGKSLLSRAEDAAAPQTCQQAPGGSGQWRTTFLWESKDLFHF